MLKLDFELFDPTAIHPLNFHPVGINFFISGDAQLPFGGISKVFCGRDSTRWTMLVGHLDSFVSPLTKLENFLHVRQYTQILVPPMPCMFISRLVHFFEVYALLLKNFSLDFCSHFFPILYILLQSFGPTIQSFNLWSSNTLRWW